MDCDLASLRLCVLMAAVSTQRRRGAKTQRGLGQEARACAGSTAELESGRSEILFRDWLCNADRWSQRRAASGICPEVTGRPSLSSRRGSADEVDEFFRPLLPPPVAIRKRPGACFPGWRVNGALWQREMMNDPVPNPAANAGERLGFAGKSRVGLSPRPGVAEFHR